MFYFLYAYIKNLNDDSIIMTSDKFGNLYVTKGEANTYPCIVSHMDTVHDIISDDRYVVLNSDKEFFAIDLKTRGATGIGGDDKCGIYTCLDNLLREKVIKLAFFVDEEIGCVGSGNADMTFFDDVSFVLQADRQGYEDVAIDIYGIEMFGGEFFVNYLSFDSSHNVRSEVIASVGNGSHHIGQLDWRHQNFTLANSIGYNSSTSPATIWIYSFIGF